MRIVIRLDVVMVVQIRVIGTPQWVQSVLPKTTIRDNP